MNRGAARITTFHDNDDYQKLIDLLLQLKRRYCFEIHAYCLMPNHYHILIRTPLPNLSTGMRHLNSLYTSYYNKKYKRDGALFRGRYKAILIDADNYLLRVSRYIHLNPVKGYLIKHPGKYLWSSYQFYVSHIATPDWLYTETILSYFGIKQQKNRYSLFVMEQTDQELEIFYSKAKLLPVLGSDIFRKKISKEVLCKIRSSKEIPDRKKVSTMPSLANICRTVAKHYQVSSRSLFAVKRSQGNLPRKIAIYLSAELSGKSFGFIATFFKNIGTAGVSQIVLRVNSARVSETSIGNISKDIIALSNLIKS
ncbi:MAG: transposase [Gammaproteobacteria bacterium]|nr:transposase [Gammaproteobacteria bacterium]